MCKRLFVLAYGVLSYVLFLGVTLYICGFVGNFGTPTSLDGPLEGPLFTALVVNLALLALFALQHSVMARPAFKRWWKQFIPEPMERSTYVLFSNLALTLLFWQWRPMGGVIWDVEQPGVRAVAHALFASGMLIVLATTFLINHFDLFGLRQVWLYFRGRPCTGLVFKTPALYRLVRHPLYVGWLIAFWATPTMTVAHLLFALGLTAYILVAIVFEERDLVAAHPEYAEYRRRVPMLLPRLPSPDSSHAPTTDQPRLARLEDGDNNGSRIINIQALEK
jgi:protein-S-isoprenylcysteine O-methyltransferase Ste14